MWIQSSIHEKKFLKYKLQYHNPLNENLQQQKMQFLQNSNDKGYKENCWYMKWLAHKSTTV